MRKVNLFRAKLNIRPNRTTSTQVSNEWVIGEPRIKTTSPYMRTELGEKQPIIKDTLCEYIGRNDDKQRPIFEGDRVSCMDDLDYRFTGVVKFHPGRLQFVVEEDKSGELFSFNKLMDVVVTGDIFQI